MDQVQLGSTFSAVENRSANGSGRPVMDLDRNRFWWFGPILQVVWHVTSCFVPREDEKERSPLFISSRVQLHLWLLILEYEMQEGEVEEDGSNKGVVDCFFLLQLPSTSM